VTYIRVAIALALFAGEFLSANAQSMVTCPQRVASREIRERALKEAGYPLTRQSILAAFQDKRADVRMFAVLELNEFGKKEDLGPALQVWSAEPDHCAKAAMNFALSFLVSDLTQDVSQHPQGQPRVALSKLCVASIPATVSLTLHQVSQAGFSGPILEVAARNQTPRMLAFVWSGDPGELFSVTALDPNGQPARVAKGKEWRYQPKGPGVEGLIADSHRIFVPLPPQEDVVLSTWRIGEDFDMSSPGTYSVSLGGRLDYLDTTVCSNTAKVTVER
jgi:hypothetical protein